MDLGLTLRILPSLIIQSVAEAYVDMPGNQQYGPMNDGMMPAMDLRCVSGYCLPTGYKKLETPYPDGE